MLNHVVDMLLPPASLVVLAFLLSLVGRSWARRLSAAMLAIVVILAIPLVSTLLLDSLAPGPVPEAAPEAIVILAADGIRIEGVQDLEPGPLTLDRMRAGVALARRTGLPILVSGGEMNDAHTTLAQMMSASLRDDFRVPARWEEGRSLDTWQNAAFSADILRPAGISRVYLVTHFWHMRRALIAFRHAGFDAVPAPVRPPFTGPFSWHDLLPKPSSWYNSYIALHEWVGLIYYRLRA